MMVVELMMFSTILIDFSHYDTKLSHSSVTQEKYNIAMNRIDHAHGAMWKHLISGQKPSRINQRFFYAI